VADYYPFGAAHEPTYESGTDNKYLYNGKGRQDDMLGGISLDWYDYGARFYDPQVGRWHVVDPMIESHFDYTGYAYTYNNPVRYIDPFGLDTLVFDQSGYYSNTIKSDGTSVLMINGEDGSQFYNFNDEEKDVKNINDMIEKYGSEAQIVFMKSNKEIESILEDSGVTDAENQGHAIKYAWDESPSGKMDYWKSNLSPEIQRGGIFKDDILKDNSGFYIFEGNSKAFNAMDAGNFLWGAGMNYLGFTKFSSKIAAHAAHILFSGQGGLIDAKADQRAIVSGHNKASELRKQ
jgi:RHS repeat-associated protein